MAEDMKATAKDAADAAKQAKGTAQDKAAHFGAAAQDYASQASDTASDLYGNAKANFTDAVNGLPNTAADAVDAGRNAYRNGSKTIGKHVSKQPIEALLLAGAIGYLVGWAANR